MGRSVSVSRFSLLAICCTIRVCLGFYVLHDTLLECLDLSVCFFLHWFVSVSVSLSVMYVDH